MNISSKLARKYLKRDKKRTIASIIGISIVVMLLTSILLGFSVYKEYMIKLQRKYANYEVKFGNIMYEKVYGLQNNKNISDVAITKQLGICLNDDTGYFTKQYVDIRAYNDIAMKNLGIELVEGRMPSNSNEIVISQNFSDDNMEDIIKGINNKKRFDLGNNEKEYTIVGIIKPTQYDSISISKQTVGAITCVDEEKIQKDSVVDVYINFNNKYNIYNKSKEIANVLKLYNGDEQIEYNSELLQYMGLFNLKDEKDIKILYTVIFFIALIVFTAIAFLYSVFNISILERKKEFRKFAITWSYQETSSKYHNQRRNNTACYFDFYWCIFKYNISSNNSGVYR